MGLAGAARYADREAKVSRNEFLGRGASRQRGRCHDFADEAAGHLILMSSIAGSWVSPTSFLQREQFALEGTPNRSLRSRALQHPRDACRTGNFKTNFTAPQR